jgi:hypothetical protein
VTSGPTELRQRLILVPTMRHRRRMFLGTAVYFTSVVAWLAWPLGMIDAANRAVAAHRDAMKAARNATGS